MLPTPPPGPSPGHLVSSLGRYFLWLGVPWHSPHLGVQTAPLRPSPHLFLLSRV